MATEAPVPPPDVTRRVELALAMIDMGAAVFPLAPGSKAPLIPKRKGGGGFLDAQRDPGRARTFLGQPGRPNYGVVFPQDSDVIVLDLDGGDRDKRPGWQADWQRLYERLGPPGLTFIVRTPSGGRHAYYRWRTDLHGPIPAGDEMLGWTVRKPWKGYLVGPGSVVNGATYEPVGAPAIADLPEAWVRAAIAEKAERRHQGDDEIRIAAHGPVQVQAGHRHAYLRDQARHLRGVGLSGEAIFTAIMDLNRQLPEPKSADDVRRAIGDVEAKFDPDPIGPDGGRVRPAPEPPSAATDRSVALSSINTDPPPPMLIDRLDPAGHTILYGTGGVGKGALACSWISDLVRSGHRVLILDYEGHPEEWSRRIAALAADVHGGDAVRHLVPRGALAAAAAEIVWTCDTYGLDYIVIDSAVMACGADPLKPESAAGYAAGLLAIGRPALSLAHVTKVDDPRYPFGSVFWHNLARMTWSMTGIESEVLLKHRKHNNYPGLGTFALTITWQDGYLREVWERGYNMTILRRVLDALEDAGALTIDQLFAVINDDEHKPVSRKTLQKTLTRALLSEVRLVSGAYARA